MKKPVDQARLIACQCIFSVLEENNYSNRELDKRLKYSSLTPIQKNFVTAMVYGTVSFVPAADYVIAKYSDVPVPKLHPWARTILRQAVWQIYESYVATDMAAVNEAVNLTEVFCKKHIKGYVNAVLRNITRNKPAFPKDKEYLKYGMTEELFDFFAEKFGKDEAMRITKASYEFKRSSCIRINRSRISLKDLSETLTNDGFKCERALYMKEEALIVKSSPLSPAASRAFSLGEYYLQAESGMFVGKIIVNKLKEKFEAREKYASADRSFTSDTASLGLPFKGEDFKNKSESAKPKSSLPALYAMPRSDPFSKIDEIVRFSPKIIGEVDLFEACAAPGSKTFDIYERMKQANISCRMVVNDKSLDRLAMLEENIKRLGIKDAILSNMDAETENLPVALKNKRLPLFYDVISADVPCSGLGTMDEHPEIKLRVNKKYLAEFPHIQLEILRRMPALLKPGGLLLYSTCTINPDENQEVIKKFFTLPEAVDMKRVVIKPEYLGDLADPDLEELIFRHFGEMNNGELSLRRDIDACSGFFIAVMEKK